MIPRATVCVAPGASIVVKRPSERRNPWMIPLGSWNHPTMSPDALIPVAKVRIAPGTSIVVKVRPKASNGAIARKRTTALSQTVGASKVFLNVS